MSASKHIIKNKCITRVGEMTTGLYGLVHQSALKYPDSIFIRNTEKSWTYRETDLIIEQISLYLLGRGIQKGDRVAVFFENSIQYVAAFFGILRINAVAVPINPSRMTESLVYIIKKSTPRLIMASIQTAGKLEKILGELDTEIIDVDSCIRANCCCRLEFDNAGVIDNDSVNFENADRAVYNSMNIENDCDALILFTSGTTAHPKGVTLTHGNLLSNTQAILDYLKLTSEDSVLMTLPFTYSYGNSVLLTHAAAGASIILENSVTFPYKVLEGIKKYRATGFSTVGSYINLMLKCIRNSENNENFLLHLRYITLAGESSNIDDISFINASCPGIKVFVMYGQTEASARLSYLSPDMLDVKGGSVGRGLCNVQLKIVDEAGNEVMPGELGEIAAKGPNIMRNYWQDPEATKEVIRDGWLYTGDIAYMDTDGFIYIKGRKTDIIKHMGHRISPAEIENVINGCSLVKESAVIESTYKGMPVIKAYIVPEKRPLLQASADLLPEEIKKYVNPRLPAYMRPYTYETIEQLPRTESGKLKRIALRRNQCAE